MGTARQKQFSQPLQLSVKGLPECVTSLEQFDRAVSRKTLITSELFAKLLTLDDDRLSSLTSATRQAADLLQRALKRAVGNPNAIDELFRKLGTAFFTEDHGWRKLFITLSALPAKRDDIKLLALSKYRNYLLARLAALNSIGSNRLQSQIHVTADSEAESVTELVVQKPGVTQELSSSETIIRDVVQLPKGKTTPIRADDMACVDIWMARRRFRIEMWDKTSFIDSHGQSTKLKEGRNLIGRALHNDVVIDPNYPEVSRNHLIVDIRDGRPVGITDLSSGGTFMSRTLVAAPRNVARAS
ncbi:MAG TPA: FHA domain-containing protein [Gammaproteobacteria bacterium]|nr:FHA domain-containing protein [Gammaproteobacteria bacterium]